MLRRIAALDLHSGTALDDVLRRIITAWRERHGVSARRFGVEALRDPNFVFSQARGRSVCLVTADRVLAYMGLARLGPCFRCEVEAFLEVTGTKASVLGAEAVGNRSLVGRLRKGTSPRLGTVDRVRAWMAAHASVEEMGTIRARIEDEHSFDQAARAGSYTAPLLLAGAGINLEEEGGNGMYENGSKYLSTREAANWLGLSPRTLDRYRVSGDGPAFHRFGSRVRYLAADLDDWAAARRRLSTSDDGTAGREGRP